MRIWFIALCLAIVGAACGNQSSPATTATSTVADVAKSTPKPAQKKARLRYEYRKGEKFTHRVRMQVAGLSKGSWQPAGTAKMELTTTVTSADQRLGTLKVQYKKVSGDPDAMPLVIAENGQAPSELLKMLAYTVKADQLGRNHGTEFAWKELGESSLQMNEDATLVGPVLPSKLVAPGDTWTSRQRIRHGASVTTATTKYTFQSWVRKGDAKLARIKSASTMTTKARRGKVDSKGNANYTYLFDPSAGLSVNTEGTTTVNVLGSGTRLRYKFTINTVKQGTSAE